MVGSCHSWGVLGKTCHRAHPSPPSLSPPPYSPSHLFHSYFTPPSSPPPNSLSYPHASPLPYSPPSYILSIPPSPIPAISLVVNNCISISMTTVFYSSQGCPYETKIRYEELFNLEKIPSEMEVAPRYNC